jgi:uncharacterized membrane protein YgcG
MIARALAVALLALGTVLASATPAVADTSDFTFDSFDAQYTLTQAADGTSRLDVVETIVARFPDYDQNRGIIRAIPTVNQDVALNPVVESIVDENGTDVYWEEYPENNFLELWLGTDDFVYGVNTYVISYTLENVVATYTSPESVDEFYWDVNGTGWEQPFGRVSTTLTVDPALSASLTGASACYYGVFGSTSECSLRANGSTYAASVTDLGSGENLAISVGFTKDTFVQGEAYVPPDPDSYEGYDPDDFMLDSPAPWWSTLIAALLLAAGVANTVVAIVVRSRKGRGAPSSGIIVPQYSVPKGLNVMVAAHLADREATAFSAQLVSLAVRKKLRILDYPVTSSGADYTIQFLDSSELDPLELEFMTALFDQVLEVGEVKELAPADVKLGTAIRTLTARAKEEQRRLGYRTAASMMGCIFPGISFLLLFASVAVGIFISSATNSFDPFMVAAGAVAFISIFITAALSISFGQGPFTPAGREKRDYLEGMKVYLNLAEKERFRMLQSPTGAERIDVGDTKQIIKLYEKLLPFAVVWGVEDQWMKELVVHAGETETPEWFESANGFNASSFTNAIRGAAVAAAYTPPAPSTSSWGGSGSSGSSWSSGFGGSSGGGFSGGGGGGGGGGGR